MPSCCAATRHATLPADATRGRGSTHAGDRHAGWAVWSLWSSKDHGPAGESWLEGGKDRVKRIWRREGLRIPQRQKPSGRHQGVPSWNLAPHQGIEERNSTAAIGLRASQHLNRVWSRYTGKNGIPNQGWTTSGLDTTPATWDDGCRPTGAHLLKLCRTRI